MVPSALGPELLSLFFFSNSDPLDICGALGLSIQLTLPPLLWCISPLFLISLLSVSFHVDTGEGLCLNILICSLPKA